MPAPVQLDGLVIDGEEHALVDTKARAALTDTTSGQSFKFGVDANGNFGYHKTVGGADTVIPFKTVKEQTKTITSNGTYNAKVTDNVDGYAEVDVQVSGGGTPPVLDSLAITQNTQAGHPITPPSGVDGYNSITVNVTPNVDRKVITGTAPFSQTFVASQQAIPLDGYSQVQVNITGGSSSTLVSKTVNIGTSQNHQTIVLDPSEESPAADGYSDVTLVVDVPTQGGDCNIRSQAQWDALTLAEKKALGLTIIKNSLSQVSGSWYDLSNASSEYLPYSSNVIGDASINNFDATSYSWGGFTLSNTLTANVDGIGVDIFGRPDASQGHPNVEAVYCDLGDVNTDFTAYLVCKYSVDFAYSAIIGASYQESSGNCAYIIEAGMNNVEGVCGGSSVVGDAHTADTYIVLVIRNNNKNISFFKNGVKGTDRTAYNVGRYVTLTTPYPNGTAYCTQITAAYAGVVNLAETDDIINANIENLMRKFNIT